MGDKLVEEPCTSTLFEAKGMLLNSYSKLFEFFQKELLCDVVICAGKRTFKCHRVVLASCSPYFQAMFTSPLTESQQNSITIGDIDGSTMEMLIVFAYTAKIELNVSNAQSLLHASSVLQLNVLAQACSDFMSEQLHPSNCLGIRQFADRHGLFTLVNLADKYAKYHFQEIISNEDFSSIDASHLEQLLASDDLCVKSEEQVYEALMLWMKSETEKKKSFFPKLLSKVRLPQLSVKYQRTHLENNSLIRTNFCCRDLMDEARDYLLWKSGHLSVHLSVNDRTKPRKSYAGILLCVGGRGLSGDPFSSTECYSWFHNKWFKMNDMSTSRRHVGCVSVNGKVYAVGGCNEKEHLQSAEVFNPLRNQWMPIASMNTPRRGLGLCCLGGPIYAVGGLDDNVFYSVVERYDIVADLWSIVAPMNSARGGVAVVEFKGHIYAFGGNSGDKSLNTCEVYNPYLNKWTFLHPMNQRRAGAGAAVLNGYIYVVGGFDHNDPLNSVEKYDPEVNVWTFVSSMNMYRGGVGVTELGRRLYAVGGHNGSQYLKTVEVYDSELDEWVIATEIADCRAGAGVTWCLCDIDDLERLNKQNSTPVISEAPKL